MRKAIAAGIWLVLGAIALFCSACATMGSSVVERMGQEQAVDIIWHGTYGRSDLPPLVRWQEGARLTCDDPQSGKRGFPIIDVDPADPDGIARMVCREGMTWSPLEVLVAWHGERSFAETALAHELLHAALLRRGIFIGHHERPDFFPTIDRANAALMAAGR